jgi:alpha-aminoadipate/glutamate carrier protein LysW
MNPTSSSLCPVCEAEVRLGTDTVVSEMVVCDSCSSALEVRSLDPLTLAEAPHEEEDWGE